MRLEVLILLILRINKVYLIVRFIVVKYIWRLVIGKMVKYRYIGFLISV